MRAYAKIFAAVVMMGSTIPAWAAQGDNVGETQMCIQTNYISSTPVIDQRTILVEMRGAGRGYKRIDLMSGCAGLDRSTGFAYETSINRLCVQDSLKVLEPVGSVCMIDKIVTIDATEAKALLKKRN